MVLRLGARDRGAGRWASRTARRGDRLGGGLTLGRDLALGRSVALARTLLGRRFLRRSLLRRSFALRRGLAARGGFGFGLALRSDGHGVRFGKAGIAGAARHEAC